MRSKKYHYLTVYIRIFVITLTLTLFLIGKVKKHLRLSSFPSIGCNRGKFSVLSSKKVKTNPSSNYIEFYSLVELFFSVFNKLTMKVVTTENCTRQWSSREPSRGLDPRPRGEFQNFLNQ